MHHLQGRRGTEGRGHLGVAEEMKGPAWHWEKSKPAKQSERNPAAEPGWPVTVGDENSWPLTGILPGTQEKAEKDNPSVLKIKFTCLPRPAASTSRPSNRTAYASRPLPSLQPSLTCWLQLRLVFACNPLLPTLLGLVPPFCGSRPKCSLLRDTSPHYPSKVGPPLLWDSAIASFKSSRHLHLFCILSAIHLRQPLSTLYASGSSGRFYLGAGKTKPPDTWYVGTRWAERA